jgi:putative ABC transport system permease protein
LQVLFESTALAVLGCGLGLVISWPISWMITKSLLFVFDFRSAALAFAAAGALNVLFALWPSRKAAYVSPLAALRYE